jgi:hypothetical protein
MLVMPPFVFVVSDAAGSLPSAPPSPLGSPTGRRRPQADRPRDGPRAAGLEEPWG